MNYYVMNEQSQMIHRDTREGCIEWATKRVNSYRHYGMPAPVLRVFYDAGREPEWTTEQLTKKGKSK